MSDHTNFRSSLIKFCKEAALDLVTIETFKEGGDFCDLDAHAQLDELPATDLVCMANFTWETTGKLFNLEVMIGVSTNSDTNLFRHHEALDYLFDRLKPESKVPVVDAETGADLGWLVVKDGVELLPMMKSQSRSVQLLHLMLTSNRTLRADL